MPGAASPLLANLAQSPPVMATLCQGDQCGTGDWREGSSCGQPVQTTLPALREGDVWGRWEPRLASPALHFHFPVVPFLDGSTNNAKRMGDRPTDRLIAARNASGRISASDRDKAPFPVAKPSRRRCIGGFQRVAEVDSRGIGMLGLLSAGTASCASTRASLPLIPIPPPREASESHADNDTRMFDGPEPL